MTTEIIPVPPVATNLVVVAPTTLELLQQAPVALDRHGWARRGTSDFDGEKVLAVGALSGSDKNLELTAQVLDHWALSTGLKIVEVQHVVRRGSRVVYARLA